MALSRRQLRAIFAKMAAMRKGGRPAAGRTQAAAPPRAPKSRPSLMGLTQSDVPKLLARLPRKHRQMSKANHFLIHKNEGALKVAYRKASRRGGEAPRGTTGFYDHYNEALHIRVDALPYLGKAGYSSRPSHIPKGSMRDVGLRLIRNAKVGSRKAFYHEYGHSVDRGSRFSNGHRWLDMGPEWRGVAPKEAWSESYTMFATSKVSRARLRRERPESYQYMKRFFEQ